MQTYFRNNNSEELIIFFCGWGMDEKPFHPLKSNADVLFLFDYVDAEKEFKFDYSKYKKISLIAFSYGVFMAGYLKNLLPKCDLKIAINGTLKPIDEEFGIPKKIFTLTLENMTELSALKFREKLFLDKADLSIFNKHIPNRDMKSSKDELATLKSYFLSGKEIDFAYDKTIIAEKDRIIPTKNQKNFWQNQPVQRFVTGGHFPFYQFETIEQIIEL